MRKFWKKYHKWVGLVFSFFIVAFCESGIILNHRTVFSSCDISRSWMPNGYQYEHWNNGIVRGTRPIGDKVLCYGNAGVWQTDSCFSHFVDYNRGIKDGADNRKISNIVELPDGSVWAAGLYDLYRLEGDEWKTWAVGENDDRITDVTSRGDTLVVVTRSLVYSATGDHKSFGKHQLKAPEGYSPEVSLFRQTWLLHSGELFGTPGKLVVDALALVLIFFCLTGWVYLLFPKWIKRRVKQKKNPKPMTETMKFSTKWHNKLGIWLFIPTLILAVTGMSLRPPMMIPLAISSSKPLPFSTLDSENPWHDKLRALRWDAAENLWIMSTSAGIHSFADFDAVPVRLKAPLVSPMGINVFEKNAEGEWLIGSFSGLKRWNFRTGEIRDYFTGEPDKRVFGRPVASIAVSGFSQHLVLADEVVFDYSRGARTRTLERLETVEMPEEMALQPMSLWNFALELHVGRCYSPFLFGIFSELFVFLSGLTLALVLVSGYVIRIRKKKK